MMMLGVEVQRDPAAPDDTGAFLAALATGRNVLVPRGDWRIAAGALPMLQRGQRIIGEGSCATALRFDGDGDGIVLCHQPDYNYRWGSGLEGLGVYCETASDPNSMGVRATGGAICTLRDVAVSGWAHHVVLDGHNSAEIDNLHLGGDQTPGHGHEYPQHGLWFTDGSEAGKGWTVGGGTNANHIRGLSVNQGGPAPVKLQGASNLISGFLSNAGGWVVGGNNNCIEHGVFEFAPQSGPAMEIKAPGVAAYMLNVLDVHAGANTLMRIDMQSTVYGLVLDGQSHGPHLLDCAWAGNVAGYCRVTGIHYDYAGTPTRRAVSVEQIYCESAVFQVLEQLLPHSQGRGAIGIGKLQPNGARLHVASEGYVPKVLSLQYGAAAPGWEWP